MKTQRGTCLPNTKHFRGNILARKKHLTRKNIFGKLAMPNSNFCSSNFSSTGTGLGEEGVEGIITTTDGFVGGHLAIRLDTVLETEPKNLKK